MALGLRRGLTWGGFPRAPRSHTYLGSGLDKATQARIQIMKVLAQLGYTQDVPMPDISTKAKAQQYIGLDMEAEQQAKQKFLETVIPNGRKKRGPINDSSKVIKFFPPAPTPGYKVARS